MNLHETKFALAFATGIIAYKALEEPVKKLLCSTFGPVGLIPGHLFLKLGLEFVGVFASAWIIAFVYNKLVGKKAL